ncbi:hypothetical protein DY000_02064154 [Brassica cretica]|uniref:Uncharacterized protein n=1 Tax=Brassica cretica TaxID=69181 RepID=A0ABQ7B0B8_BRACR|nr:hypothetical protein DY000_02064154 [Brassica cretica]
MASSQAHSSKLKAGCFKEMVDQIPAILKVRNVKKRLDLMGVDMLLIDATATAHPSLNQSPYA